ncbi:protein Wnt-4 isoform X2 [Hyalella azteca]|uniref:Protein Wnt n=1 Tax=Hyalella azteca TaxID=294128 RepID=A0A8B7MZ69_HYAAZ|nr:protein Wnt-4 isoform X2 [Hyalella azteca]
MCCKLRCLRMARLGQGMCSTRSSFVVHNRRECRLVTAAVGRPHTTLLTTSWKCQKLALMLALLTALTPTASAIQWLAVSQMSSLASVPQHAGICKGLKGTLVPQQVQFCRENPFFMEAVKLGALEAINECQFQFRTQRWNCSALAAANGNPYFPLPRNVRNDVMQMDENDRNISGARSPNEYNKLHSASNRGPNTKKKRQSPMAAKLKSGPIDPYNKNSQNRNSYGTHHYAQQHGNSYNYNNKFSYNVKREEQFYASGVNRAAESLKAVPTDVLDHRYNDVTDATIAYNSNSNNRSVLSPSDVIIPDVSTSTSRSPSLSTYTDGPLERPDEPSRVEDDEDRRRRKRPRRKDKKNRRTSDNRKDKKVSSSLVPFPFPVVPRGTRESAFVHAIASAGVAHAITLRCSSGALDDCGCDHSVKGQTAEGFQWSGCSHNIAYGVSLSKRFVDARDKKKVQRAQQAMRRQPRSTGKRNRVARALINLHNNEAGRQLLQQDMRVGCKCHGVSGSCELKTCWRQMPAFREVGELLKEKFDGATEVKLKTVAGRLKLIPNKQLFKSLAEDDLVFGASSPEYCDFDPSGGSLGTHGRVCNKTSGGVDSCDRLCCDRGYTSSQQLVQERCSCKFHWCCYVECRTCLKEVTVHTCN